MGFFNIYGFNEEKNKAVKERLIVYKTEIENLNEDEALTSHVESLISYLASTFGDGFTPIKRLKKYRHGGNEQDSICIAIIEGIINGIDDNSVKKE